MGRSISKNEMNATLGSTSSSLLDAVRSSTQELAADKFNVELTETHSAEIRLGSQ